MSRVRGIFPLALATAFGIANGVGVFLPALKEQAVEKAGEPLEVAGEAKQDDIEVVRSAEVAVSQAASTESVLKSEESWSLQSLWSGASSNINNTPSTNRPSNEIKK